MVFCYHVAGSCVANTGTGDVMLSTVAFLPHSPKSGTAAPQTWHDDYDDDDDDDDAHLIIYC